MVWKIVINSIAARPGQGPDRIECPDKTESEYTLSVKAVLLKCQFPRWFYQYNKS